VVYRDSIKRAEKWKDIMVGRGESAHHFLRRDETSWSIYDRTGELLGESQNITNRHIEEVTDTVQVDRSILEADVREFMLNEDLTLIACAENHAGASAADHSNFSVICRRMLMEADAQDLRHVFIVEGRKWPCRVVGVVADLTRLSGKMTDVFVDRVRWLRNSWPLVAEHHADVFAERLAKTRSSYVLELLEDCGKSAGVSSDIVLGIKSMWSLAGPGLRYRCAQQIVSTLREGITLAPQTPETFTSDIVDQHGKRVIQACQKLLRRR
jgi:hypothetical protein